MTTLLLLLLLLIKWSDENQEGNLTTKCTRTMYRPMHTWKPWAGADNFWAWFNIRWAPNNNYFSRSSQQNACAKYTNIADNKLYSVAHSGRGMTSFWRSTLNYDEYLRYYWLPLGARSFIHSFVHLLRVSLRAHIHFIGHSLLVRKCICHVA